MLISNLHTLGGTTFLKHNITFLAGLTRAFFNVTLIDDSEPEDDDETFGLVIVAQMLPTCVFIFSSGT